MIPTLAQRIVSREYAHGPRASFSVHSFAHVVDFLQFLSGSFFVLSKIAGWARLETRQVFVLPTHSSVAPAVNLGEVVDSIKIAVG